MGWIKSVLLIVARSLGIIENEQRANQAEAQQDLGAMAQREADKTKTIEAKDEQLEAAVNRRPGDARRRMRKGTF